MYVFSKYTSGGELFYRLSVLKRFSLEVLFKCISFISHNLTQQATFYAAQITCALGYLNSVNWIEQLEPDQILLDEDGYIMMKLKYGNFIEDHTLTTCYSCVGMPEYSG